MFCYNCGKEIPENIMFCMHCGAKVADEETQEKEVVQGKRPKSKKRMLIVIIGIICSLGIVAGLLGTKVLNAKKEALYHELGLRKSVTRYTGPDYVGTEKYIKEKDIPFELELSKGFNEKYEYKINNQNLT